MTLQQICDVSILLGEDLNTNRIFGTHKKRMDGNRDRDLASEMKDILSDWYNEELYNMKRQDALTKLINIFVSSEVHCPPLAKKISHIMKQQLYLDTNSAYFTMTPHIYSKQSRDFFMLFANAG